MKKRILLVFLFQLGILSGQNSLIAIRGVDPDYALRTDQTELPFPEGHLTVLDQTTGNWPAYSPLDPLTEEFTDPPGNFSSLLLAEQLEKLNFATPFNVSHNATLERFIRVYLKYRKETLSKLMGKASYYFPAIEASLDKYNLPLEIKYLAIVESALDPRAVSASGAKGLWQFMYGTGVEYGLYIDSYIDERFDPLKATEAACAYISDLYKTFGDWDLALAAYNSGPANVRKALMRSGGNSGYWEIRKYLPKETQGYIPAFYATLYLFTHADFHGIDPVPQHISYFETDTVYVKGALTFQHIHKHTSIDMELLRSLNPQFKHERIPYLKNRKLVLTLPKEGVSRFLNEEARLYACSSDDLSVTGSQAIPIKPDNSYVVKEGDNLKGIAEKHGITLATLKAWNGLETNFLIQGQRLVVKDKSALAPVEKTQKDRSQSVKNNDPLQQFPGSYTVKEGDTLFAISKRFKKVTVEDLKTWNSLSETDYIKPGTVLKIRSN